jgi:putative transcriptional regulator
MTTKPRFKSDALAAIHTSATALQKVGAINQTTMRKFDASCLATVETSRARTRRAPLQGTS